LGTTAVGQRLQDVYRRLLAAYGPQRWWPADGPFEVMVGAVLTQNTAWTNVEKAIDNIKAAGALNPRAIRDMPPDELARMIYSCGYYNVKAKRLKALVGWLGQAGNEDPPGLDHRSTDSLRQDLLAVYGIGPETADSIILYAARRPVFVIDAYTRRICRRLGLMPAMDNYTAYQSLFMENLPRETLLYNEYHALLVQLGKTVCRPRPDCPECCLRDVCADYRQEVVS
jgi:endonuclease-3 related protein